MLGKRIARQLKVLRHIPEHRVYELSVEWEAEASSSVFYLSEIYLYPYSLRIDDSTKPNKTLKPARELTGNSTAPDTTALSISNHPQNSDTIAEQTNLLDYDSASRQPQHNLQMTGRKREIVMSRQTGEGRKRRKQE